MRPNARPRTDRVLLCFVLSLGDLYERYLGWYDRWVKPRPTTDR
jgi:hypothetical protein